MFLIYGFASPSATKKVESSASALHPKNKVLEKQSNR